VRNSRTMAANDDIQAPSYTEQGGDLTGSFDACRKSASQECSMNLAHSLSILVSPISSTPLRIRKIWENSLDCIGGQSFDISPGTYHSSTSLHQNVDRNQARFGHKSIPCLRHSGQIPMRDRCEMHRTLTSSHPRSGFVLELSPLEPTERHSG